MNSGQNQNGRLLLGELTNSAEFKIIRTAVIDKVRAESQTEEEVEP